MGNRHRGSGSVYQPKGTANWHIQYYADGRVYHESSHSPKKNIAEKLLRRRLGEIATHNFTGPRIERITVKELAEDFLRDYTINGRKSADDAKARWELHLQPFFGHLKAVNVSTDLVSRYIDARQQEHAKNATINRELAALKRMFKLAEKSTPPKVYRVPAFPRLEERNVRKGFLEDSQYERLAAECAKEGLWLRALLEVGYSYGWRISELLNLRVEQVDLLARKIRLEPGTTKNDDGREVVMTGAVFELLKPCVIGKDAKGFVFTRSNGKRVKDFRGLWEKACKAAEVPDLLFHDLRRTAVRNMVRAGVPERVAMQISGHRTRAIFDRYHIVSERDMVDAAERIEARTNENRTRTATVERSDSGVATAANVN